MKSKLEHDRKYGKRSWYRWAKGQWTRLMARRISPHDYFGHVDGLRFRTSSTTISFDVCSEESLAQLADACNAALAHWRRASLQSARENGTVRSFLLPISRVTFTYHLERDHMTCLGEYAPNGHRT